MLRTLMVFIVCFVGGCLFSAGVGFAGFLDKKTDKERKNFRASVEWIEDADAAYGPGDYGRKIRVDDTTRYYEIHVPSSYKKGNPAPVVLVFHGGGGDPGAVRFESGMDKTADREGFIVVYPAGTNKRLLIKDRMLLWNDGRPFKDGSYSKTDDVGYVAALLEDLSKLFSIDQKRVYACGYSNGAQFSYRLAKELSNRIAAIAAVAGQRSVKDEMLPVPSRPVSIMQFAGKKDTIGPYYGGKPSIDAELKTTLAPVEDTIKSWVEFNKCPSDPAEVQKIGNAIKKRYGPCLDNTEVVFWTLEDGGHTWPGGNPFPGFEQKLGPVTRDIRASDAMWDFFRRHSLK